MRKPSRGAWTLRASTWGSCPALQAPTVMWEARMMLPSNACKRRECKFGSGHRGRGFCLCPARSACCACTTHQQQAHPDLPLKTRLGSCACPQHTVE